MYLIDQGWCNAKDQQKLYGYTNYMIYYKQNDNHYEVEVASIASEFNFVTFHILS